MNYKIFKKVIKSTDNIAACVERKSFGKQIDTLEITNQWSKCEFIEDLYWFFVTHQHQQEIQQYHNDLLKNDIVVFNDINTGEDVRIYTNDIILLEIQGRKTKIITRPLRSSLKTA